MKSQMLKLDAPYQVIYAGGFVGRHIATLVTWTEDDEGAEMVDSVSYPIIDMGNEFPAGKMVPIDLDDCRALCPPEGTNLFWVAKIIEYDFQQLEPAGAEYILERMKILGCRIVMPTEKDAETGEQVQMMRFTSTPWSSSGSGLSAPRLMRNSWRSISTSVVLSMMSSSRLRIT